MSNQMTLKMQAARDKLIADQAAKQQKPDSQELAEPQQQPSQQQTQQPAEPVQQAAPTQQQDAPALKAPNWETSYRRSQEELRKTKQALQTLQGKYNKEVKAVKEQLAQTQGATQTSRLDQVKESEAFKKLTDELGSVEADAVLDVLATMVPAPAEPAATTDVVQTEYVDEDEFCAVLDVNYPGWEVLNNSDAFNDWAKRTIDPISGFNYYTVLGDAQRENDPQRAIRIFDHYKSSNPNKGDPNADPRTPFVEPIPSGGGGPVQTPDTQTFKQGYLTEIDTLLRTKKITPEEHAKGRAAYFKAVKEGRVS